MGIKEFPPIKDELVIGGVEVVIFILLVMLSWSLDMSDFECRNNSRLSSCYYKDRWCSKRQHGALRFGSGALMVRLHLD